MKKILLTLLSFVAAIQLYAQDTYPVTFKIPDTDGQAIAGTYIDIRNLQNQYIAGSSMDNTGETVIPLPGGAYTYSVRRNGYSLNKGSVTVETTGQMVEISYADYYPVSFTVKDADGQTISPANIYLRDDLNQVNVYGLTGNDGESIFRLNNGEYTYNVQPTGYYTQTGAITIHNAPQNKIISYAGAHAVTFTVQDAAGKRVNNIPVQIDGEENNVTAGGTTDGNGEITIRLPDGNYSYRAGYYNQHNQSGSLTVNGVSQSKNIVLTGYYAVTFKASDGEDRPIADLNININNAPSRRTDGNGEAVIYLPAGSYSYQTSRMGTIERTGNVIIKDTDVTEPVRFAGSFAVTFKLTDAKGQAVNGQSINIYDALDQQGLISARTNNDGTALVYLTNGDYTYRIDDYTISGIFTKLGALTVRNASQIKEIVYADAYPVTFLLKRASGQAVERTIVNVKDTKMQILSGGETDSNGEAVIHLPAGEYTYQIGHEIVPITTGYITVSHAAQTKKIVFYDAVFSVKDTDGQPRSDVNVEIHNSRGNVINYSQLLTDSDGMVVLPLPNGEYTYEVFGTPHQHGSFTINNASQTKEIKFPRLYTATFKATNSTGQDVNGLSVKIKLASGEILYENSTYGNGEFLTGLPNGNYIYHVEYNGYSGTGGSFTINDASQTINISFDGPYPVTFRLKDAESKPARGIRVGIYDDTYGDMWLAAEVYTDNNGEATVGLRNGTYTCQAGQTGLPTQDVSITVKDAALTREIVLNGYHAVTFVVKDADGLPISGLYTLSHFMPVSTDDNGEAVVCLPDGEYFYRFYNGDLTQDVTFVVEGAPLTKTIVFADHHAVTFIIKDADGLPVGDQTVEISGVNGYTDSDGKAVVYLPNGNYSYHIKSSNHTGNITVDNAALTREVSLTDYYAVTFTVVDTGDSYSYAGITLRNAMGEPVATGRTDSNNAKVFYLSNGDYSYTVSPQYYFPLTASYYFPQTGTISVRYAPQIKKISLAGYHPVTFTVKEANGQPISGLDFYLYDTVSGQSSISEHWTTDSNGEVVFNLPDGDYTYIVRRSGYANLTGSVIVKDAALTKEISYTGYHAVTFIAKDTGDLPISGLSIKIYNTKDAFMPYGYTDSNGKTIVYLPNGDYTYNVYRHGYAEQTGAITVKDVAQIKEISYTGYYAVTFIAKDAGDLPISSLNVDIINTKNTSMSVANGYTDSTGKTIVYLPDGDYTYNVSCPGYAEQTGAVTVKGVAQVKEISYAGYHAVTFIVKDAGGQPISDLNVYTYNTNNTLTSVAYGRTDSNGETIIYLPVGDYAYSIDHEGHSAKTGAVTVKDAAQTKEVIFDDMYYAVTFKVMDAGRQAVRNGSIDIFDKQGIQVAYCDTGSNGEAVIRFTNGNYSYRAYMEGYSVKTGTITVKDATQTKEIIFDDMYHTVTFKVTDSGGSVIGNLEIIIFDMQGMPVTYCTTDSNGEGMIRITDGAYKYTAYRNGYPDKNGSFAVSGKDMIQVISYASIPVTGISLDKESVTMVVATSQTLHATVLPAEAVQTVIWSSDHPEIATVDTEGKVTGIAAGIAIVTAITAEDGKIATCKVTVIPAETGTAVIAGTVTGTTGGTVVYLYRLQTSPQKSTAPEGYILVGSVVTDANGQYQFENLPSGTYVVIVDILGYESQPSQAIQLANGGEAERINFIIDSTNHTVKPETTTGIEDHEVSLAMVYPNPNDGRFMLNFTEHGTYRISIANISGKVLLRETVTGQSKQMDISNYTNGVYLLMVENGKRKTTIRIVKNQ